MKNYKKKKSKSNCPAEQELVLHTLEQIPEDERFEAKLLNLFSGVVEVKRYDAIKTNLAG